MFSWPAVFVICSLFVCNPTTSGKVNDAVSSKANPPGVGPPGVTHLCLTPECIYEAARILKNMNSTVNPCDDFYEFVCGNYAKTEYMANPRMMGKLEVDSRLRKILEDIDESKAPKTFADLKTSWKNCIKEEWKNDSASRIEASRKVLETADVWRSLFKYQWNESAFNYSSLYSYLLKFDETLDVNNFTNRALELSIQSPPVPWGHLKKGASSKVAEAYLMYMTDIILFLGVDKSLELTDLLQVLLFEIELSKIVLAENVTYDINRQYTKMTLRELKTKYPTLHLKEFSWETDNTTVQMKMDGGIIDKLENWMVGKSKKTLANWLTWRWTAGRVSRLGSYGVYRLKKLQKSVYGYVEPDIKWKKCIQKLYSDAPFFLDVLYYGQYMRENIVEDSSKILSNIQQQFFSLVRKAQWLKTRTKLGALEKIASISNNFVTYERLMLIKESNVSHNSLKLSNGLLADNRANVPGILTHLALALSDEIENKGRWTFLKSIGNYIPELTLLNVGAIIYTDIFYNIYRPKALNYGAFGFLLSHELAHSLDDTNRHVDTKGNLRPWWDSESNETFVERIKCLVEQYKKYGFDEFGLDLNSFATRNEDIADNVGVMVAYSAYDKWLKQDNKPEKKLPGLDYSSNQMFWIGFGNTQCSKVQPQYFRTAIYEDDHSPAKLRTNVPLSNMPEFSRDFKCQLGSRMHPVKTCNVW